MPRAIFFCTLLEPSPPKLLSTALCAARSLTCLRSCAPRPCMHVLDGALRLPEARQSRLVMTGRHVLVTFIIWACEDSSPPQRSGLILPLVCAAAPRLGRGRPRRPRGCCQGPRCVSRRRVGDVRDSDEETVLTGASTCEEGGFGRKRLVQGGEEGSALRAV